MKVFDNIPLCLLFMIIHSTTCKFLPIKDIAIFSYEIITQGVDVIDRLKSGGDIEKIQESINHLQKSIQELHKNLDDNTQLVNKLICEVKEQSHKTVFLENIEHIESCITDLENVLENPFDIIVRENFKNCYDIKKNVRGIGKYLTGETTIESRTIYEFTCDEDGLEKGQNIERRFNYLYSHFIDGCTVLVTAERLKSQNKSTTLRDECWKTIEKINSSKNIYYEKSINKSCSTLYKQSNELFNGQTTILNVYTILDGLQRNFPYFQFIVVESKDSASTVNNTGNFYLNAMKFVVGGRTFHVFRTDCFVSFDKDKTTQNQQFVNVSISFDDYEDLSYGMNLSENTSREKKLVSIIGYTSDETIDTQCTYLQGPKALSTASSTENSLANLFSILLFWLFILL